MGPSERSHGRHGDGSLRFAESPQSASRVEKLVRAEGFPILREFTGAEGFPNAYVMGPDNVKVEMQEDTTLPVRASVNHLHYYAKEVESLRAWYVTNFGAHARKRGTLETTADISTVNLTFMLMKPEDSIVGTKMADRWIISALK